MIKRFLPYIGPLIGITGVSLALYFHAQSVQERMPLYYVGPRATIVDSSIATPSPIQVLYKGHPVGNASVVTTIVYFWNGGKLPIRGEDVLEPVSIDLAYSEILEARILHVSRPVTKFGIQPVADSSKNALPVSFGILEKYDGGAVQIIYAGKPDAPITVHGTIVGAGTPRLLAVGHQRTPEEALQKLNRTNHFVDLLSYATTLAFIFFLVVALLKRPKPEEQHPAARRRRLQIFGIAALCIMYLGMDVIIYLDAHRPEVPDTVVGR